MNKLLLLLSMTVVIVACSNAPVQDENALPDGVMQPVAGTGATAEGGFMPEIEQQSMPAEMK